MENELLNYLRDIGAKIISLFGASQKQSKEQHEALRETIADEAITTRNLIKALDEAEEKPEPPEKIDLTPIIKSQEAEANFTRKTIEAGTKEIEKLTKVTESSAKTLSEASKSISKAVENFKVTIPPQKEFQFPKIDFKVITEPLSRLFSLVKEGFNSMLARGTKEDPIYVKHLDPEGNPVDPSKVIAYGGAPSSSSGGTDMTATNALLEDIKTNTNDIKLNTDDIEAPLNAIEAQTFGLVGTLEDIRSYTGPLDDVAKNSGENGSVNARLRHMSAKSEEQSGFQQNIQENTAKISAEMLKASVQVSATGTILTPTAGMRLRIFAIKFSLTANLDDVAFNFNGEADFEKYLAPKTGGLYGHSISPNYTSGDVDQPLEISITGTANVQVNIDYQEVN